MKSNKFIFFVCAIVLSMNVAARTPVAIIPHDNIPVVTGSHNLPATEQVEAAIKAAATAKNWSTAPSSDGTLVATLVVRNKHSIMVKISYAPDNYSITYKDSINMKYGVAPPVYAGYIQVDKGGYPAIHPYYNNWVQELQDAIQIELLKL